MRKAILLSLLLSACNATGIEYTGEQSGNLVVYRPWHTVNSLGYYYMDMNGKPVCGLGNGGYFIKHATGKTTISSSLWNQPGTSRITINVDKKTYIKIEHNSQRMLVGAIGGLGGQLLDEGVSDYSGPFIISQIPQSQALVELRGLKQDCQ